MAAPRVYAIPTGPGADAEVLTVSSDELPADANELLDIIKEFTTDTWTPPLATYADLAVEYTRRGLLTEAGKAVRAGLDPSEQGVLEAPDFWSASPVLRFCCRARKVRQGTSRGRPEL